MPLHSLLLSASLVIRPAPPPPPGVVVDHLSPQAGKYIGSPSLTRLPDGTLLIQHDEFGDASSQGTAGVTRLFRSTDHGQHWAPLATTRGMFWSTLFTHSGALYRLGTSGEYGSLILSRSVDGGATWTEPRDAATGLLRPGRWHTAPVPVIEHAGRIWRAVEDCDGPGGWGTMFRPRMISAPADGILLNAATWRITDPLPRDGDWLGDGGPFKLALEGNAVLSRSGRVLDILRTDHEALAGILTASPDGATLAAVPALDRTPLPGSGSKFQIRWDATARIYYALANLPPAPAPSPAHLSGPADSPDPGSARNTLALLASPDLRTWTCQAVLLHDPDAAHHAFQYPDWLPEGDDLLVASRTAWPDGDGDPPRGHDANYLTFHRFPGFRALRPPATVPTTLPGATP